MTTALLAMHGWAGDSRGWEPFAVAARSRGWLWQAPDRGYGPCPPQAALWQPEAGRRVLLAHSLGPHLLPPEVLAAADAVVLLASFGRFVPPERGKRRLTAALAGMAEALNGAEPEGMLWAFLAEAAAPQPVSQLPVTVVDEPLRPEGRQRLQEDLELLAGTGALPSALPATIPCLIVEAGADRIVVPAAREQLRRERPTAAVIHYPGAGHCLLGTPVVRDLMAWIDTL
ncbi:MAG: alpha/beta fold hydrolase [Synechococcaceae cyanobacterium]